MMDSEFKQLIDTFMRLGIEHSIAWGCTKEKWQKHITDAGYNLTALACTAVETKDVEFLFSNGQAHWIGESGHGPHGVFLLSRNRQTGEIRSRGHYIANRKLTGKTGLSALRGTYHF